MNVYVFSKYLVSELGDAVTTSLANYVGDKGSFLQPLSVRFCLSLYTILFNKKISKRPNKVSIQISLAWSLTGQ